MTDKILPGWDITAVEYAQRPGTGRAMLYGTGTPDIKATPQMIADNPYCVMVDQSPYIDAIDTTMDVYDMETGALTLTELGEVIHDAIDQRAHHIRAGQRVPLIYASESRLDEVIRTLDKAQLQDKCGLFPAHWGVSVTDASNRILTASGPYPVRAMQIANAGTYDRDLFSVNWLSTSGEWNHSWTCHRQQWTLDQLAAKLNITVTALKPSNNPAVYVRTAYMKGDHKMLVPPGSHFTYSTMP